MKMKINVRTLCIVSASLLTLGPIAAAHAQDEIQREAVIHGMRSGYSSVNISPDGSKIVYVAASKGDDSLAIVADLKTGEQRQVAFTDGNPFRLQWCDWATNKRILCNLYGVTNKTRNGDWASYTKYVAFDENGKDFVDLERKSRAGFVWDQTWGGTILAWPQDDTILIHRFQLPENHGGPTRNTNENYGYVVESVDLNTGKSKKEESPDANAVDYIADEAGVVRIKGEQKEDNKAEYYSRVDYSYRPKGSRDWKAFSSVVDDQGLMPIAFAENENAVYAFDRTTGRYALYKVSLDGSMNKELLLADSTVDVDGLMMLGRRGRVIGAAYQGATEQRIYFDKELESITKRLKALLPGNPNVHLVSATEDERKLIFEATSAQDTGRYFFFDRDSNEVKLIMSANPVHKGIAMGEVRPISYKAGDGTDIPAYLTLPPGVASAKGLPALVMPHGGPSSRDTYGYDWLAQYFAARGFAVLQPNFRGSTGFGSAFEGKNGFREWRKAIGDINDGGRWLLTQGVPADKLGIFGWSYGGYAALQTSVVDPDLYKVIVAVAPVVDFEMLANDWGRGDRGTRKFAGLQDDPKGGSPIRHVGVIKAPVLLISGDADLNVDIRHTKEMAKELRKAGKKVETIVYEGLDHQLPDSDARMDMLVKSDKWIRDALGLPEKP